MNDWYTEYEDSLEYGNSTQDIIDRYTRGCEDEQDNY